MAYITGNMPGSKLDGIDQTITARLIQLEVLITASLAERQELDELSLGEPAFLTSDETAQRVSLEVRIAAYSQERMFLTGLQGLVRR